MTIKYISLDNLKLYHEKLMECIDSKLELHDYGVTNCPNCGAIIRSSECEYCGTNFMKWVPLNKVTSDK